MIVTQALWALVLFPVKNSGVDCGFLPALNLCAFVQFCRSFQEVLKDYLFQLKKVQIKNFFSSLQINRGGAKTILPN